MPTRKCMIVFPSLTWLRLQRERWTSPAFAYSSPIGTGTWTRSRDPRCAAHAGTKRSTGDRICTRNKKYKSILRLSPRLSGVIKPHWHVQLNPESEHSCLLSHSLPQARCLTSTPSVPWEEQTTPAHMGLTFLRLKHTSPAPTMRPRQGLIDI